MENFANYILHERIRETRNSLIYRGQKASDSHSLIIKILKTRYPTPSEVATFNQEYNIISNINIDGIIKLYDFVEHDNRYAIVEEYFEGRSLKEIIKAAKLETILFLDIALKLSETFGLLHSNNIIHRNINPDNILINDKRDVVKIADLGISTVLTHANDEIYNPDVIERSLAYMSPEQTGRMNRTVDYRTDLYSLGITFYEILTGSVPFKSNDPMEVIHSHIARMPNAPSELDPTIPSTISAIVMKLLSKAPEDRYQNSMGLMADFRECFDQLSRNNKIKMFPLATKDIQLRFNIPQMIVGRENELKSLLQAFDRVSMGTSEISLILGHSGIGKSALVNEISKSIIAKKGYFVLGKYDRLGNDVPYSAIVQSFQALIRRILAEGEQRFTIWKNRLLSALGSNGKVIIDVIPELEYIIGVQPDVPELNPNESRHRFNLAFRDLIGVFADREHPLAIFLDDLQWADLASLALIKTIVSDSETRYLHFIGAYRDKEVGPGHPLVNILEEIRKSDKQINRILLNPLNSSQINQMIVNILRCKSDESFDLANIVYKKTAGNPFYVNQFLKSLYDSGILELHPVSGWKWDINKIKEAQVSENVVEFMAQRISSLPTNAQDMLKICACLGNSFDLETLAVVSSQSLDDTLVDLTLAIKEDLVYVHGDTYRFYHDRIQEAAYSLISNNDRTELHYRIGTNTLKNTQKQNLDNKIYYIVDQLNKGKRLITEYNARNNLLSLNMLAAGKARKSAAFAIAADYFNTGRSLLSLEEWKVQPHKLFELSIQHAEAVFLSGDIKKASQLCDKLFELATNDLDKGSIYNLKARIVDYLGAKREDVIDEIRKGLLLFGMSLPKDHQEIDRMMGEGIGKMQASLEKVPPEKLVDLPRMTDENKVMVMNLLFQAIPAAIQSYPPLYILIELIMLDMAITHGTTVVSCKNFVGCGMIQGSILGDYEKGYRLARAAFAIMNKYNAESYKSSVYFVFSTFISQWRVHYQESLDYYDMSYQSGLEMGDIQHTAYCSAHKIHRLFYTGTNLDECRRATENSIAFLNNISAVIQLFVSRILLHAIKKLQTTPAKDPDDTGLKKDRKILEEARNSNAFSVCMFGQCNTMVQYLLHNIEEAEAWSDFTEPFIQGGVGYFPMPDHYLYQSLILARKWKDVSVDERVRILEKLIENQKRLMHWSDNCPSNFAHKYFLASAEIANIQGESLETITGLYKNAVDSIGKDDFIHLRALAHELHGRFWLENGYDTVGKAYIVEAYYLYRQWGAFAKLKKLEEEYSNIVLESHAMVGVNTIRDSAIDTASSAATAYQTLDLATVIKTSQALSGEIELDRLLKTFVNLSLENAGAERGCLILKDSKDNRLYIEATGTVDSPIEVMTSIPVSGNDTISTLIVSYVNKTGEDVVLDDASIDERFSNDPYIIENRPKSILCAPIRRKGIISGIIYLENNLTTRAFTPQRVQLLQILASQAAISIENARLVKVREDVAKLQTEMKIAANIQSTLLPDNPVVPGYDIAAYLMPIEEVGGDYYDIINIEDISWLIVGDVSGHGVPAGLVMMMVQSAVRTQVRKYPDIRPSELLSAVNETIKYNIRKMKADRYMTITAFRFKKEGKVLYSGLHLDTILYRASTSRIEIVRSVGIWLSPWDISEENVDRELKLEKGDVMVFYTDGIIEARNTNGEMFSLTRLEKTLQEFGKSRVADIKDKVFAQLQGYTIDDDATLVVLKAI